MIKKITLKQVASYGDDPVVIETDKKINLIYGLNGTGKTTISKYLQNSDYNSFSHCSIEGLSNEKVLVYNQKFIDDNFYQDTQKGIFSLKSENKEAKLKIEMANEELLGLNRQINDEDLGTGLEIDLKKNQKSIDDLLEEKSKKTWEIKKRFSVGDGILEFCLAGKKGDKNALFDYILELPKPEEKPKQSFEDLKKIAESTQGDDAKAYDSIIFSKNSFGFADIEEQEIFNEVIIGNDNSQVAELINRLNNSTWVKEGKSFINNLVTENQVCPFCQQKTISKEFLEEINNYFDETYETKLSELEALRQDYSKEIRNLKNLKSEIFKSEILELNIIKDQESVLEGLFQKLITKVDNNLLKVGNKISNMDTAFSLESTQIEQDTLNDFFEELVTKILDHNEQIKNKDNTKNEIKKSFWNINRWDYDQTIEDFISQNTKLKAKKVEIENQIADTRVKIREQKNLIIDSQGEMVNIQDAIDVINTELVLFGLGGFSIIPANENSYKLKRPNEAIAKFETLSEGEKTVISFLYFIELCKGREKNDEVTTEKIVVIDDPISSLSHMYVFNVAQLIRKHFFGSEYKQLFILTHNLYFFHELLHKEKHTVFKLFRLCRGEYSKVVDLDKKEIQNEYEAYWRIIKDDNKGWANEALLANAMRNILEKFFGFIEKNDYRELTEELEKDEKNHSFIRYMNKESHADAINISDSKEINVDIFKAAFKKIFYDADYAKHYEKMMEG